MSTAVKVILIVVVVFVLLLAIGAALVGLQKPANQSAAKVVTAPPSQVVIAISDIPETGWQLQDSGSNSTTAWRLFADNSNPYATYAFRLTLWTEPDANAAAANMTSFVSRLSYSTQDGSVRGSDASRWWSVDGGYRASMIVRRYNAVFLVEGTAGGYGYISDIDLGDWSGWQLIKIETTAH